MTVVAAKQLDGICLRCPQTAGVFNLALDEDNVFSSPFTLLPSTRTTSSSTPSSSLLIAQYSSTESVCTENIDA